MKDDKVKKAAQALIDRLEQEHNFDDLWDEYTNLRNALTPSREEIIDGLDDILVSWFSDGTKERVALENAIAELRKGVVMAIQKETDGVKWVEVQKGG